MAENKKDRGRNLRNRYCQRRSLFSRRGNQEAGNEASAGETEAKEAEEKRG